MEEPEIEIKNSKNYIEDIPECIILRSFENFELYRYRTIGDGGCFYHAILMGINEFYRKRQTSDGTYIDRRELVKTVREKISNLLDVKIDPNDPKSKTYYETLANGELSEISKNVSMVKLDRLKAILNSKEFLGQEIIEISSIFFKINILILDISNQNVYKTFVTFQEKYGSSVVLFYNGDHYDLCGVVQKDGFIATHFKNSHTFIKRCLELNC